MKFRRLMETNVSRAKNKKLLIASSCLVEDMPSLFEKYGEEFFGLKVCMEAECFNMVAYKVLSFIKYSNVDEVHIVTVEGSPHCIQLHHMLDDIKKNFANVKTRHFVATRGELVEIPYEVVKVSRYLARLKNRLLK